MKARFARPRFSLPVSLVVTLIAAAGGCAAHHELQSASSAAGPPLPAESKALLARRCGGCHAIPDPTSMSAEKWLSGVERMKKRMELPAAEWDSLAIMAQYAQAQP